MPSHVSSVLGLPYIQPAQAQKHVTHNEALRLLDVIVQLAVESHDRGTPPEGAADGDRHIVGSNPSGAWAGCEDCVAVFEDGAWRMVEPRSGWRAEVPSAGLSLVFDGVGWVPSGGEGGMLPPSVARLGVNATADDGNRFAVASPATLLTHEGAGHRLKINKASSGDTASLLFQTGWSGRAEMGCAGSDAFSVKVSADGGAWREAFSADPETGVLRAPQGVEAAAVTGTAVQQHAGDVTPGRLARAEWTYGPGTVVGAVAMSEGLPSGAVIESGEGYVRLADGTQICRATLTAADDGETAWGYPRPFSEMPAVTATAVSTAEGLIAARLATRTSAQARFSVFDVSGARVAAEVDVVAVGRWT